MNKNLPLQIYPFIIRDKMVNVEPENIFLVYGYRMEDALVEVKKHYPSSHVKMMGSVLFPKNIEIEKKTSSETKIHFAKYNLDFLLKDKSMAKIREKLTKRDISDLNRIVKKLDVKNKNKNRERKKT